MSKPQLWWCPAGDSRTDFALRSYFKLPAWYNDPTYAPAGINWGSSHREQVNYAYWVGPSRVTPSMPKVLRFSDSLVPTKRVVWADNIKTPGATNAGISWSHPANTHDTDGDAVALGTYNAMVDGHVQWIASQWPDNVESWNFQYLLTN
jgi:hypothetical protein